MSYIYDYKLKNVGGRATSGQIDLHRYVSLSLTQRRINEKLISTYKLTDIDGYTTTLDFYDRQDQAFDFFTEWRKAIQTNK